MENKNVQKKLGRPTIDQKDYRGHQVNIRLTATEYDDVHRMAEEMEMTVSTFIREVLTGNVVINVG